MIRFNNTNFKLLNLGGYNLPNTMDLFQWGDVIFYNNDQKALVYKNKSKAEYHIKFNDNYSMNVDYKLNNKSIIQFKDTLLDNNDLSTFIRDFENKTFKFDKGKLTSKIKSYIFNQIEALQRRHYYVNEFITLDIETKIVDNVIIPYAISYYDGKVVRSFYETDFINHKEMIKTCLSSLLIRKYHNFKIYVPNLSNFDGIFIFDLLTEIGQKVNFIIDDGKFVDITVKFKDKYSIHFRDSYLMLPSSLQKIS